jgi:lipopolysaccharide/colanic/teichoic acid biosynthesis glycosyltransferase
LSLRARFYLNEEPQQRFHLDRVATQSQRSSSSSSRDEALQISRPPQVTNWCNSILKRCFDLAITVPALIVALPVIGGIAIAIKLTSSGSVLFRQLRVGRNQVPFVIFKFRTMTNRAEFSGPSVTRWGDPRLTPIGSFLRRFKLDELPQLFNVLLGNMSLVGPRPKLHQHEKMFIACRPGITGAATMVFCDEEKLLANIPEALVEQYTLSVLNPVKVMLDQEYLRSASLLTDLRILAKTLLGLGDAAALPRLAVSSSPEQKDFPVVSISSGYKFARRRPADNSSGSRNLPVHRAPVPCIAATVNELKVEA